MNTKKIEEKLKILDRLIKYREHFRKFHEFEDNLVNQRIAFFLTSQSILLIAHFTIFLNTGLLEQSSNLQFILLLVLATFSIIICGYIKAVIEAAFIIKDTIDEQWFIFIKELVNYFGEAEIQDKERRLPELMFHADKESNPNTKIINDRIEEYWSNLKPFKIRRFYDIPKYFQCFWLFLIVFDFLIIFKTKIDIIFSKIKLFTNVSLDIFINWFFIIILLFIILYLFVYVFTDRKYMPKNKKQNSKIKVSK